MRCDCCNRALNDYESTLKSANTGEYLNTCRKCLEGLGITYIEREDLAPNEEVIDDEFDDLDGEFRAGEEDVE